MGVSIGASSSSTDIPNDEFATQTTVPLTQPGNSVGEEPTRMSLSSEVQTQLLSELERNNEVIRKLLASQASIECTPTDGIPQEMGSPESPKTAIPPLLPTQPVGRPPEVAGENANAGNQPTKATEDATAGASKTPVAAGVSYADAMRGSQGGRTPQPTGTQIPSVTHGLKGDRSIVAKALNRMPQPDEKTTPKKRLEWKLSGAEADEVGRRVLILESRAFCPMTSSTRVVSQEELDEAMRKATQNQEAQMAVDSEVQEEQPKSTKPEIEVVPTPSRPNNGIPPAPKGVEVAPNPYASLQGTEEVESGQEDVEVLDLNTPAKMDFE
ncbi:hypothetical protein R1sor_022875 [Riccia sorocarpa]|uniref:Uncharacterized protein n=1 Tax=Riccia sorocarpa TaxID=122646 RepID=A0ABD3GNA3_9MARC